MSTCKGRRLAQLAQGCLGLPATSPCLLTSGPGPPGRDGPCAPFSPHPPGCPHSGGGAQKQHPLQQAAPDLPAHRDLLPLPAGPAVKGEAGTHSAPASTSPEVPRALPVTSLFWKGRFLPKEILFNGWGNRGPERLSPRLRSHSWLGESRSLQRPEMVEQTAETVFHKHEGSVQRKWGLGEGAAGSRGSAVREPADSSLGGCLARPRDGSPENAARPPAPGP